MSIPYLIQRGKIYPINLKYSKGKAKCISEIKKLTEMVKLDYMGSAEFEFGALPKSLRRIETSFDNYILNLQNYENEKIFYIFAKKEDMEIYKNDYIPKLIKKEIRLKEFIFSDYFSFDFFWDIENDTMFFEYKRFKYIIKDVLQKSFDYMNKKN